MNAKQEQQLIEYVMALSSRVAELETSNKVQKDTYNKLQDKFSKMEKVITRLRYANKTLAAKINFAKEKISALESISRYNKR